MPSTHSKKQDVITDFSTLTEDADFDFDAALDLGQVPEFEFQVLPNGTYPGYIKGIQQEQSKKGNNMLHVEVGIPYEGKERALHYYLVLRNDLLHNLKRFVQNLAPYATNEVDLSNFKISEANEAFTGTPCSVKVQIDSYQGRKNNKVKDILAPTEDFGDEFE